MACRVCTVQSLYDHFLQCWHCSHTSRGRLLLNTSPQLLRHGHSSYETRPFFVLDRRHYSLSLLILRYLSNSFLIYFSRLVLLCEASFAAGPSLFCFCFPFYNWSGDEVSIVADSALRLRGRGRLNFGRGDGVIYRDGIVYGGCKTGFAAVGAVTGFAAVFAEKQRLNIAHYKLSSLNEWRVLIKLYSYILRYFLSTVYMELSQ